MQIKTEIDTMKVLTIILRQM